MSVIIRLVGRIHGGPSPHDGRYVVNYDPRLIGGAFLLETTGLRSRAKRFPSAIEAIAFYRQVCPNLPEDSPGHANRPLCAFTVELLPI